MNSLPKRLNPQVRDKAEASGGRRTEAGSPKSRPTGRTRLSRPNRREVRVTVVGVLVFRSNRAEDTSPFEAKNGNQPRLGMGAILIPTPTGLHSKAKGWPQAFPGNPPEHPQSTPTGLRRPEDGGQKPTLRLGPKPQSPWRDALVVSRRWALRRSA